MQTHPFARSYRMKALPNYYDLVLIYGNVIDNENHHLPLDKNLQDDISEVKGGESQVPYKHLDLFTKLFRTN